MRIKGKFKHVILKGSWAKLYKSYLRNDKDRTYHSKYERDIDRKHDMLLKAELLKSQKANERVDNTTLLGISAELFTKARRMLASVQYEEAGFTSPLMKNILEMDEIPQIVCRDDAEYYQVMCNISDKALSEEIIEWFIQKAPGYDPTYHKENESINIILYSILTGRGFNEEKATELSKISRQEFYELICSQLSESEFNDGADMISFRTKGEKLRDWFFINFKI